MPGRGSEDILVDVRKLSVRYFRKRKPVLDNVSFSLKRGEVALILGKTGSGKSTLLYTVAGIIPKLVPAHIEGNVSVLGRKPEKEGLVGLAGELGIVLQDPESQVVMFKVKEEVEFSLENLNFAPSEIEMLAHRALEMTGLEEYAEREVDTLSTGLKQRLALASILAFRPRLLLLDEPTSHLDPASAQEFYKIISRLKKEGTSVLLVEHRISYIESLVDKIFYLRNGKIAEYESIRSLIKEEGPLRLISEGIWIPATYLEEHNGVVSCGKSEKGGLGAEVEVENLSVTVDGQEILRDLSLIVKRGELAIILGPNGSGKTTFLKVLAGAVKGYQGRVYIDKKPPNPAAVAYVTQIPEHMFVARQVLEEIATTFSVMGFKKREAERLAEDVLSKYGLSHLAHRNIYKLSQGEKRLVSLLSMIPLDRSLYLLDEPTFGLDLRYTLNVIKMVAELKSLGKTVILVTHDSWILPLLHGKIYGISDGKLVFRGTIYDLLASRDVWEKIRFAPTPELLEMIRETGVERAIENYRRKIGVCA